MRKGVKSRSCSKPAVSSPPLTKTEFEEFLTTVTRPVQKPRPAKEKPQT